MLRTRWAAVAVLCQGLFFGLVSGARPLQSLQPLLLLLVCLLIPAWQASPEQKAQTTICLQSMANQSM
jgi:hypothetical protein